MKLGASPQTPGIYRVYCLPVVVLFLPGQRDLRATPVRRYRPRSRRSGCIPALPYPPLRSAQH
jgi:hypothetical protein